MGLYQILAILCMVACIPTVVNAGANDEKFPWPDKPNIIIFYGDDVGWADFSSLDILHKRRLPQRVGVRDRGRVFGATCTNGLPRLEITIPEALKDVGYSTGMVGKWHLGVNAHNHNDGEHLPYNHGFDYVGTNFGTGNSWFCDEEQWHVDEPSTLGCALYKNATIIQQPYSHYGLSETLVNDAVDFIRSSQQAPPPHRKPFFLYYALTQTHVDLFTSNEGFRGSSKRGRYGDNINEMSWEVGAILDEVKRLGLASNTLSIFSSDNGPWLQLCNEGGDAGVFKGGKMQFWEGGIRVPTIFHWPGHIRPKTTSDELTSMTDIFPTLMNIVGGSVPDDRPMDGQDISSTLFNWWPEPQPEPVATKRLFNEVDVTSHDPRILVFYCESTLYAVRYRSYKFHFHTQKAWTKEGHHAEPGRCGDGGFPLQQNTYCGACTPNPNFPPDCLSDHDPPLMFNVDKDPNEAYSLDTAIPEHQAVLVEMMSNWMFFGYHGPRTSLIR
ncbi:arylsulfatase-like [Amphiura filiformis]|uniref:arylsulfatase-like n=1 Tax=Amphiura filiformis TaxID=82378 RepID=UPI003B21600A